jgi:predicted ATP-dependent protease
LSREHGVIIPRSNMKDLMLRRDVVAACAKGEFAVYAVDHVDEVMELLTGKKAGKRQGGKYPSGTINSKVEARLKEFSHASVGAGRGGWL